MNEKGFCESRNPFLCYVDKEIYQIKERNHHCERVRSSIIGIWKQF